MKKKKSELQQLEEMFRRVVKLLWILLGVELVIFIGLALIQ